VWQRALLLSNLEQEQRRCRRHAANQPERREVFWAVLVCKLDGHTSVDDRQCEVHSLLNTPPGFDSVSGVQGTSTTTNWSSTKGPHTHTACVACRVSPRRRAATPLWMMLTPDHVNRHCERGCGSRAVICGEARQECSASWGRPGGKASQRWRQHGTEDSPLPPWLLPALPLSSPALILSPGRPAPSLSQPLRATEG
jgi:hypothetical protein